MTLLKIGNYSPWKELKHSISRENTLWMAIHRKKEDKEEKKKN